MLIGGGMAGHTTRLVCLVGHNGRMLEVSIGTGFFRVRGMQELACWVFDQRFPGWIIAPAYLQREGNLLNGLASFI